MLVGREVGTLVGTHTAPATFLLPRAGRVTAVSDTGMEAYSGWKSFQMEKISLWADRP